MPGGIPAGRLWWELRPPAVPGGEAEGGSLMDDRVCAKLQAWAQPSMGTAYQELAACRIAPCPCSLTRRREVTGFGVEGVGGAELRCPPVQI